MFQIDKRNGNGEIGKREKRLLQNRKSALKCRLKKQGELDTMKGQVDNLAKENLGLKEEVRFFNLITLRFPL